MISTGRNGVTSNWSNVPCSRSRATDMAVSRIVCSSVSVPIRLGIMLQRVSRLGLYHARRDNPNRRVRPGLGGPPVGIECFDDGGRRNPARSPAVLELRPSAITWTSARQARHQPPLEILVDLDGQQRSPVVDHGSQVGGPIQVGHAAENAGPVQLRQQFVRRGAAVLVEHGIGDVVEVVGRHVADRSGTAGSAE